LIWEARFGRSCFDKEEIMAAKTQVIDFSDVDENPEEDARPLNADGKLMTGKQVRSRARRRLQKGKKLDDETFEAWAGKPIEEWDLEELARGRTRDVSGGFRGKPPQYMPRAVHERIAERFKLVVRDQMNQNATLALGVVSNLIGNDDVDDKGKPLVPASVKLDASKWLIEHVIGKPVQPTQADVSVKLQGILGAVMVQPQMGDENTPALPRGYTAGHFGTRGESVIDVEAEWDDE
jgi:hypothetical protein